MNFDAFVESAWNDHGERPGEVAARLASSFDVIGSDGNLAEYARLVTHVFGEHLGQWREGIDVVQSLGALPPAKGSQIAGAAIVRSIATLRYASGDELALDDLGVEERIRVLATAAAALAGRDQFKRALAAYARAVQLGSADLAQGSPAARALAVGGNNLAAALEAKPDRDAAETEGMIAAAEAGLKHWRVAGTWLEEERALYRLARSLLQAGQPARAIENAKRCIDVCENHQAPPFEAFFGHAALAIALRAAGDTAAFEASRAHALHLLDLVAPDEREWCAGDLAELRA